MDLNGITDFLEWGNISPEMETLAISASSTPENFASKCIVTPIVTSSSFIFEGAGATALEPETSKDGVVKKLRAFDYGRHGNPTRNALESYFAQLEGAKHALAFGSGVAALGAVMLSLKQGDHVVASKAIYGGSNTILKDVRKYGISVDFFNTTDTDEIIRLIRYDTKVVYFESPSNPDLRLWDISEISRKVHETNPDIWVVVDNTFLTPLFQKCLKLGADIVLYSTSKYIGGHADIIGGMVCTSSETIFKHIKNSQEVWGGVPSPFDCYMTIRSLKTLPLRMHRHYETALRVAKFLETHSQVLKVIHPGLKSHPQHDLALKQQLGHSGMIGFYVKGGFKAAVDFMNSVRVIRKAPSLGADISLVTIPAKMSHIGLSQEERNDLGITDNFLRLSIGLEAHQSLIDDLNQALNRTI